MNVILWCSMKHQRIYQSCQDLSSEEPDCCGGETKNVSEITNSPGLLSIFSYKSTVPSFYSKHVSDWLTAEWDHWVFSTRTGNPTGLLRGALDSSSSVALSRGTKSILQTSFSTFVLSRHLLLFLLEVCSSSSLSHSPHPKVHLQVHLGHYNPAERDSPPPRPHLSLSRSPFSSLSPATVRSLLVLRDKSLPSCLWLSLSLHPLHFYLTLSVSPFIYSPALHLFFSLTPRSPFTRFICTFSFNLFLSDSVFPPLHARSWQIVDTAVLFLNLNVKETLFYSINRRETHVFSPVSSSFSSLCLFSPFFPLFIQSGLLRVMRLHGIIKGCLSVIHTAQSHFTV